jgi:hypothetical protein
MVGQRTINRIQDRAIMYFSLDRKSAIEKQTLLGSSGNRVADFMRRDERLLHGDSGKGRKACGNRGHQDADAHSSHRLCDEFLRASNDEEDS